MLINQSIVVGEYGFFGYIPEMLRVVKFIEVAFELSALCACQFHRIGKDFVTGRSGRYIAGRIRARSQARTPRRFSASRQALRPS